MDVFDRCGSNEAESKLKDLSNKLSDSDAALQVSESRLKDFVSEYTLLEVTVKLYFDATFFYANFLIIFRTGILEEKLLSLEALMGDKQDEDNVGQHCDQINDN